MRNLTIATAIAVFCGASFGADEAPRPPMSGRTVYFGVGMTDEDIVVASSAIAAGDPWGVLLLDGPKAGKLAKPYLAALRPKTIVPIGPEADSLAELEERLGTKLATPMPWKRGPPDALWKMLFPQAPSVVVCPAEPRGQLLLAACLAASLRAPLYVIRGVPGETAELRGRLSAWKTTEIVAVGLNAERFADVDGIRMTRLTDEQAVSAAYVRQLAKAGPVRNLAVTNPVDATQEGGGMSVLAPWIAVQRRAALLLTNEDGNNTRTVVDAAVRMPEAARADTLIIVANLRAIPVEKRPNPVQGKDAEIEMEPMTPTGDEPFGFGIGRLFHDDASLLALTLARQALLAEDGKPRKALVVSNPGGGLPLLETFSRHTANELRNTGYETTALFENQAEKEQVRKLVAENDIFLWEGHYRTLIDEFGFLNWTEPIPPSLCFLQSCLALKEEEAKPLFERGALAIVGSSTRTYSGTGGAFTVAFFNAMLYEGQTLGGSLRQAKNYLLAYSMLKEKRLGSAAKLTGVNVRSAWAFSLWGDPTLRLPRPPVPKEVRDPVRHEMRGTTLVVSLPGETYDKVKVDKYQAQMSPNARLAGLLTTPTAGEDIKQLVPFVFAEVRLPNAPPGKTPHLTSKLADRNWVFVWDNRRKSGYLLVTPRTNEQRDLKFKVEWDE